MEQTEQRKILLTFLPIRALSDSQYHVMVPGSVSGKMLFLYPCMQYGQQVSMLCFETKLESHVCFSSPIPNEEK